MRTIRFRGKIESGDWLYGDLRHRGWLWPAIIESYCTDEGKVGCCEVAVDGKTVGQFTGLTDVNGKEIYEGDIIVQHDEDMPDIRGTVVYDEENARFGMAYTSYWESGCVTHFDTLERVKCYSDRNCELTYEIIGNIHDNPDLMLAKDINIFKCEM